MDEREIGRLLQRGRTAAFRGRPADGVAPLERLVAGPRPAEGVWLYGVVLTALGRYGAALALPPVAGPWGALQAAARGAAYRQLGHHADGEVADRACLAMTPTCADAVADGRIGLVADAVGQARVDLAVQRSEAAARAVAAAPDPRHRIRLAWVRAEVALLTGRPADAVAHGRVALAAARRAGFPRHVAKSLLFLGVAEREAGHPGAEAHLRAAAASADALGLLPLAWPAHAVLGNVAAARSAVGEIGAQLPPDLAEAWFAAPDRAALLG